MRETIEQTLYQLEQAENIRILLAVESGSRAWGFASPDSDYDVRFIYVRTEKDYMQLEGLRDVIELPLTGDLDINGWDLRKTLQLLHNANPTLFEWFSSPVIYRTTAFAEQFKALMAGYFSSKRGLRHYLSMACGNYRQYLKGEQVRAKKYFYVLRPLLACRWILRKGTPPPMLFSALMDSELDRRIRPQVEHLLSLKMNAPEIAIIPRINVLNDYMDAVIDELNLAVSGLPDEPSKGWAELNHLFLSQIKSGSASPLR